MKSLLLQEFEWLTMDACAELSFVWGGESIQFTLRRDERRRLKVSVTPLGEIIVIAPLDATADEVVRRVSRRGSWIIRQLKDFEKWRPRTPPRQYVSGETHLFLGRQYRLRVLTSDRPDIGIDGDRLVVAVPENSDFAYRRMVLRHWYRLQAHGLFPSRLDVVFSTFLRDGIERPHLIIRDMSKRWGSFTPKGNLVLNQDLIRASTNCIDYVIAHELAHALEPDHGLGWQRLMDRVMPDWIERKTELEARLL